MKDDAGGDSIRDSIHGGHHETELALAVALVLAMSTAAKRVDHLSVRLRLAERLELRLGL